MSSQEAKRTLIYAILKFLRDELKQEGITGDFKESLEVASQCLESSYEISIDDELCRNNFDAGLDLVGLAEKSVIKREIPQDLKDRADRYKNEGNELMKQEKFKEALESYNKAIDVDKNNAVYYCNRAAAHSKLNDFTNSIEDCKNALKIDPSYGKAWGRLGLALLSNNQNEEAYEAYSKAIQLEPTNEGYKQNLKIVEEKLRTSATSAFPDMSNLGNMMSMFNNPQFMNMASQIMADPQMQNVMTNLVSSMFTGGGGASGVGGMPAPPRPPTSANPSETTPTSGPGGPSSIPGMEGVPGGFESILASAQNWASQMNPEFVQQMRERLNINTASSNNNSSSSNNEEPRPKND